MTLDMETIPLASVRADPTNARLHSPRNLAAIAASLRRFGQQKPIVIDHDNMLLAGHGTVEAARSLGWTHMQAVRTELTGVEATAYAIADNRTGDLSTWHPERLAAALERVRVGTEACAAATGYTPADIARLVRQCGVDAPEAEAPTIAPSWHIVARCADGADQRKLYDELTARGYACRVLTV